MTRTLPVAASLLAFALAAAPLAADTPPPAAKASPLFEKIKTLLGEWQGKGSDGNPVTVGYRLISGGTCVEEQISHGTEGNMTSVYCPDGDALLMTHYCLANNQPRMHAARLSPDGKRIEFAFVDVGNLTDPAAGHMRQLVLTLEDADHLKQEWTWREKGNDKAPEVFQLARKK